MQKQPALSRMDLKCEIWLQWWLETDGHSKQQLQHLHPPYIDSLWFHTVTVTHALSALFLIPCSICPSFPSVLPLIRFLFKSPLSHRSKAINLLAMQAVGFNHLQTMSDFCFISHLSDMEIYCMSSTQYFEME